MYKRLAASYHNVSCHKLLLKGRRWSAGSQRRAWLQRGRMCRDQRSRGFILVEYRSISNARRIPYTAKVRDRDGFSFAKAL